MSKKEEIFLPTKEELTLSVDQAEWSWLRAHLQRGALILVDDSVDLAEAALKVASDNVDIVADWMNNGRLSKPTEAQVKLWDQSKDKKFSILIVSPYVLFQEKNPTFH